MESVGQSKTGNGVSDTLMLGSRKKMVGGEQITVTVLYSRSGEETLWEQFKLFLFGKSLEEKAKKKILEYLGEKSDNNPAIKRLLNEIRQSNDGVTASKFLEAVTLVKIGGGDLLEGSKIILQTDRPKGAEEISKHYLIDTIWRLMNDSKSQKSIEEQAGLLLKLGSFQTSIEERDVLLAQVDALEKSIKKQQKMSNGDQESPASRKELEQLKESVNTAQLSVPNQDEIKKLKDFKNILLTHGTSSELLKNISLRIEKLLEASGQSTRPWTPQDVARKQSTSSDDKFVDVPLDS